MPDTPDRTPTPTRCYTDAEERALRAAGLDPKRGPAQFAGGHWWPDELLRRAKEAERLVPLLRVASAALRREIASDPLTAEGVRDA